MGSHSVLPSRYKGVLYRSRTEARWAVFFDAAKISVEYEPEGYTLNGNPYLPDFYAPALETFFEVKGSDPTQAEIAKALALNAHTGKRVLFLVRSPSQEGYLADPETGEKRGMLARCRDCGIGYWQVYSCAWRSISGHDSSCSGDAKFSALDAEVSAAKNERFGVFV